MLGALALSDGEFQGAVWGFFSCVFYLVWLFYFFFPPCFFDSLGACCLFTSITVSC